MYEPATDVDNTTWNKGDLKEQRKIEFSDSNSAPVSIGKLARGR